MFQIFASAHFGHFEDRSSKLALIFLTESKKNNELTIKICSRKAELNWMKRTLLERNSKNSNFLPNSATKIVKKVTAVRSETPSIFDGSPRKQLLDQIIENFQQPYRNQWNSPGKNFIDSLSFLSSKRGGEEEEEMNRLVQVNIY